MSRQMGSAHAEQGLGSFPPCPLSHCRWLIPVRDSSWQAGRTILPCLPSATSKSWKNPPVVFQKRHTNFYGEGSAESRLQLFPPFSRSPT